MLSPGPRARERARSPAPTAGLGCGAARKAGDGRCAWAAVRPAGHQHPQQAIVKHVSWGTRVIWDTSWIAARRLCDADPSRVIAAGRWRSPLLAAGPRFPRWLACGRGRGGPPPRGGARTLAVPWSRSDHAAAAGPRAD